MMHTLSEGLKAVVGVVPDAHGAGTVNGAAIDTLGFNRALIIVNSGTNEATGTLDVKVQHCATSGGTYADITDAVFTQITTANDNTIYVGEVKIGAVNSVNRYIRVVAVIGTASGDSGSVVILGRAEDLPVEQVNTVEFSV
jgi:hypothetical protein